MLATAAKDIHAKVTTLGPSARWIENKDDRSSLLRESNEKIDLLARSSSLTSIARCREGSSSNLWILSRIHVPGSISLLFSSATGARTKPRRGTKTIQEGERVVGLGRCCCYCSSSGTCKMSGAVHFVADSLWFCFLHSLSRALWGLRIGLLSTNNTTASASASGVGWIAFLGEICACVRWIHLD